MAEIELSVLSKQCLNRRIATAEEMEKQVLAWEKERNEKREKVVWRFQTADARIKLKHLNQYLPDFGWLLIATMY